MANNKEVKSNRDKVRERIQAKYPDRTFEEDEEIFGQIDGDYDEYDRQISESQGREKAFSDMFTSDPRSARLMMGWKNGQDPAVALISIYGDDILEAVNDPEKQEEIKKANKEYADRVAKEKDYENEYQSNLASSLETLSQIQKQNGYTDEQIDQAMGHIVENATNVLMGKFTPEMIESAMKSLNYDKAVAAASEEGEVAGRNQKIEETLRRRGRSDGAPQLNGRNGTPAAQRNVPNLGALDRFDGESKNIWDRGNERRTRMG